MNGASAGRGRLKTREEEIGARCASPSLSRMHKTSSSVVFECKIETKDFSTGDNMEFGIKKIHSTAAQRA